MIVLAIYPGGSMLAKESSGGGEERENVSLEECILGTERWWAGREPPSPVLVESLDRAAI